MTRRLLVVDDEPGMRETLVDIFEAAGYDVTAAVSGEAALDELRVETYDVVLMDIRMPGRDGVTVLLEIGPPPPKVIMMTAYAVEEKLREALRSHAYAIVHKPFQVDRLLGLVAGASAA